MANLKNVMWGHLFAYIDPGSSSYFFQLLIAGLTTVVFFFSAMKRKVLRLFRKSKATEESPTPSPKSAEKSQSDPRLIQQ